jgi:hemoglobin/transferrin/lactoferrin receptor protein
MNNFGIYAQHLYKAAGGKVVLNDGLRVQATTLHSTIRDNSFFGFPFTRIDGEHTAITGNLGIVYMPSGSWRINAGIATGFRAPYVDDASRIFESNTASRQLIVPNPGIKPEYTYSADLGVAFKKSDRFRFEAGVFHTWFRNAIALAPFRFKGSDSVTYNGTSVLVFANQNVNTAFIYGVNSSIAVLLAPRVNLASTINYTVGKLQPQAREEVPLDHIPPLYGKTGITYTHPLLETEVYALYNGWKKIGDYNPSGEDNAQYATPEGTPSWMTLNFRASLKVAKVLTLQAGVENVLDRNYRYFASGFSAPGRNFILALRSRF